MNKYDKRTWAEIDLAALAHNYREIRAHSAETCKFLGVVKADAYGHGANIIASELETLGADYLAVACLDEAVQLREYGIKMPILVLGSTPARYAKELVKYDITQSIASLGAAQEISKNLGDMSIKVHYKIDTGMGRLGFALDCATEEVGKALAIGNLEAEGIFTHFATADEENDNFTAKQLSEFLDCVNAIEERYGYKFEIKHCANSGAVINYEETGLDMTRAGIALYGGYDSYASVDFDLKPVMSFKSRISDINEHDVGDTISYGRTYTVDSRRKIAVISVGYADGLFRCLSNRFSVSVAGALAPQVGRICMDMCMIDVTDIDVSEQDEVVIFGDDKTPLSQLSKLANTITYELLCSISPRVPRVYKR